MTAARPVREFAPAKINLCLHVTGQRSDGYHLLDSVVMFAGAEAADFVDVTLGGTGFEVVGPLAEGVPTGPDNLALKAAAAMGARCRIQLTKHLPAAAGIGGGTADGAAVVRALVAAGHAPLTEDAALALGADMPVCLTGRAARMTGIGEQIIPLFDWPALHVVLVNPGVDVPTAAVFRGLAQKANAPLGGPWPKTATAHAVVDWLRAQRNDLEAPALAVAPEIGAVLTDLRGQPGCGLARMSGSGATCFGVFENRDLAKAAAVALARDGWWVRATTLS